MGNCCSEAIHKFSEVSIFGQESLIINHKGSSYPWPSRFFPKRIKSYHLLNILHECQIPFFRKYGITKSWRKLAVRGNGERDLNLHKTIRPLTSLKRFRITVDHGEKFQTDRYLAKFLHKNNKIRELELFVNSSPLACIPTREISNLRDLESLTLSCYNIPSGGNKRLLSIPIRKSIKLKRVHLSFHNVDIISSRKLYQFFRELVALEALEEVSVYLYLDPEIVSKESLIKCVNLLSRIQRLKKFELQMFHDDDEDDVFVRALGKTLSTKTTLESISIKFLNDKIIDVHLPHSYSALISSISNLKKLKTLELSIDNILEPKSSINFPYTVTMIEKSENLSTMGLSNSDRYNRELFNPLVSLTQLSHFTWSSSIPINSGITSLFEFLRISSKLEFLKLNITEPYRYSKEELIALTDGFKALKSLRHLEILNFYCSGQEVVEKLMQGISYCTNLRKFLIKSEDVLTCKKRRIVYETIGNFKYLESLEVYFYDTSVYISPLAFYEMLGSLRKLRTLIAHIQFVESNMDFFISEFSKYISPKLQLGLTLRLSNPRMYFLKKIAIAMMKLQTLFQLKIELYVLDGVNESIYDDINSFNYTLTLLPNIKDLDYFVNAGETSSVRFLEYITQLFPKMSRLRALKIDIEGNQRDTCERQKETLITRLAPMQELEEVCIKVNRQFVVQYHKHLK